MGKLSFFEKIKIPKYNDPYQIEQGLIKFDKDRCTGCRLCIRACPACAIILDDNKAKMVDPPECMGCGDCVAICPENVIALVKSYRYTGRYKTIDQGKLEMPRI